MTKGFDGERYSRSSRPQKEIGRSVIDSIKWRGDERVVDLGCGDGKLTAEIASRLSSGSVLGLDSSASMIEAARKHRAENLSFQVMDVTHLSFVEEFDLAFSNAALHWVLDQRTMLGNLRQGLKHRGRLRVNFAGDGNCPNLLEGMRRKMADERFRERFRGFRWPWYMPSAQEYARVLEEAGFEQIEVWSERADRLFSSEKEYRPFIENMAIVPLLDQFEDLGERDAFRQAVLTEIMDLSRAPGGFYEPFLRINASAVRP